MSKQQLFDKLEENINQIILSEVANSEKKQQICILLKNNILYYNWVGFYVLDNTGKFLLLEEYDGATTDHVKIPVGKGVCGQVAEANDARIIQDVMAEQNYLSCSIDVKSEIVVPIRRDGKFIAELDIDSHLLSPFSEEDTAFLTKICEKMVVLF